MCSCSLVALRSVRSVGFRCVVAPLRSFASDVYPDDVVPGAEERVLTLCDTVDRRCKRTVYQDLGRRGAELDSPPVKPYAATVCGHKFLAVKRPR